MHSSRKMNQVNIWGLIHYRVMPSIIRGALDGFIDDLYVIAEVTIKGAQ
jgi:hypothetical protein